MASLNIKDPEVYALARRVADRTGQSMTRVIREALENWDRQQQAGAGKADAAELMGLARRISAQLPGPAPDHGALLYDEAGLPR